MGNRIWLKTAYQNKGIPGVLKELFTRTVYHCTSYPVIRLLAAAPLRVRKDRIVFLTDVDFTDNARALYDYMLRRGYSRRYEIIWLVASPRRYRSWRRRNVKFVKKNFFNTTFESARAHYYVWTSGTVFFTHSLRWAPKRSQEQTYINLWHGCGYKAAKGNSSEIKFDYLLTPAPVFSETKSEFFQCDRSKFLPLGYPRYDQLLTGEAKARTYLSQKLRAAGADKTVIWMPTFRRSDHVKVMDDTLSGETNLPVFYTKKDLKKLDGVCARRKILLLIKRHQYQIDYDTGRHQYRNLWFFDDKDLEHEGILLYELLAGTDALISDYSSVAVDYLLLDRPMGFTLDDYEQYCSSRGFVFDDPLEYMPGSHIYNCQDFYEFLEKTAKGQDDHAAERARVRAIFHSETTPGFCRRILEYFAENGIFDSDKPVGR